MSAVGTLFDCSFTKETGFSGNGKCSVWMSDTVRRPSALHASRDQTASSAARVAAICSSAPSSPLALYAQPPCTLTSPGPCSAAASLTINNAAEPPRKKITAHFELLIVTESMLLVQERDCLHSRKSLTMAPVV